jgi:dimethylhistidine N-methyltransferase
VSTASALSLASARSHLAIFARDVSEGLSKPQKQLPPQYLYDDVGSALFEAITHLPEYGLTRADERVISRCAPVLASSFPGKVAIAELGSGSGVKTRFILQEFAGRPGVTYYPIDVSPAALERCRAELSGYCDVQPVFDTYLAGMSFVAARRKPGQKLLVLFLGSTIANFSPDAAVHFLVQLRRMLKPGDALLIGADLVKSASQLVLGYDDPAGVTAAFNKNVLCRINRELGADFDPTQFQHVARYSTPHQRIEMHLRSVVRQTVVIRALNRTFSFRKGETIWTESSYKFLPDQLPRLAAECGFQHSVSWQDAEWPFVECLWKVARLPSEVAGPDL